MGELGYTAIVGVRSNVKQDSAAKYCICKVPDGKVLSRADMVLYGPQNSSEHEKGICVSETIFADDNTLELLQTVTNYHTNELPEIKALIYVDWIKHKES